jgi:hypothetical protein
VQVGRHGGIFRQVAADGVEAPEAVVGEEAAADEELVDRRLAALELGARVLEVEHRDRLGRERGGERDRVRGREVDRQRALRPAAARRERCGEQRAPQLRRSDAPASHQKFHVATRASSTPFTMPWFWSAYS